MKTDILTVFFPAGLLDYFEVESHKSGDDFHEFQLVEKNEPPDGYKKSEITSKGFYEGGQISDFPLRGKRCIYKVRRRKWVVKSTGSVITRDWGLVAKGTRMTDEFASFLKGVNR